MSRDIRVEGVSMIFHGRGDPVVALENVDLKVPASRFGSIIGPSGCGKSTLFRLLAAVMQPSGGHVRLGGQTPALARRDHALGFVFQSPTLLPWRTVRQNVALPVDIVGRARARRAARSPDDLLELVGLQGFENALPHQL